MKWNDIPYDQHASPEAKALEFDLQIVENGGTLPVANEEQEEGQDENEEQAEQA